MKLRVELWAYGIPGMGIILDRHVALSRPKLQCRGSATIPLSRPLFWPQMATSATQVSLGSLKMVPNDSFITQNMGFDTRAISIECSEADNTKLEFHFLKYFLTSYSPSTQFLDFRSIWGFWKWSQMIPHTPKPGVRHQNQVFSIFRTKVRNLLLEGVLDLLHPLHPVLGLQVDLRLLKLVPNDSSCTKTLVLPLEPCF